jgi:hypothetical protein
MVFISGGNVFGKHICLIIAIRGTDKIIRSFPDDVIVFVFNFCFHPELFIVLRIEYMNVFYFKDYFPKLYDVTFPEFIALDNFIICTFFLEE